MKTQLLFYVLQVLLVEGSLDLISLRVGTRHKLEELRRFMSEEDYDVWQLTVEEILFLIPSSEADRLGRYVRLERLVSDVGLRLLSDHLDRNAQAKWDADLLSPLPYFAPSEEIRAWLTKHQKQSGLFSVLSIGRTYEEKDMLVYRFARSGRRRAAALIVSGIHGRDWLAVASVIHVIEKMTILLAEKDRTVLRLLDKIDFYFLPVANPDGYDFTHSSASLFRRLWTKTRRPLGGGCYGVDPDRNFDFGFQRQNLENTPCHRLYPGIRPATELCVRNIQNFGKFLGDRLRLFFDVRAFGQFIFTPEVTDVRANAEMRRVALASSRAAQKTTGGRFRVVTAAEVKHIHSGAMMDWFQFRTSVNASLGIAVPPHRDESAEGFLASPEEIPQSGAAVMSAVVAAAEAVTRSSP